MKDLVEKVEKEVMEKIKWHKETTLNHYDFWNEHLKYVYDESLNLANKYGADIEIVKLGALLHDIALIEKVGTRADHHINGAKIGKKILEKYNCPQDIKERVIGCIYNHRDLQKTQNIEEKCVCEGDCLSHFYNITMLYSVAFRDPNATLDEVREFMKKRFEKDFNDLSEETKKEFTERYNIINQIIFGNM